MKITSNPNIVTVPMASQCGCVSWASYTRIIAGMVKSGELTLNPGEYIAGVEIDAQGLKFVIERAK